MLQSQGVDVGAPVGKDSSVLTRIFQGQSQGGTGRFSGRCTEHLHSCNGSVMCSWKKHKRSCSQGLGKLFTEDQRKAQLWACQAELWCGLE